jgi:hypothetical protein
MDVCFHSFSSTHQRLSCQFLFSHLFMFSFLPSLAVALVYAHWFRHKVALFVWLIPLAVLAFKFASFPAGSVLDEGKQFGQAFHYYFGGDFFIPEFHNYEELFSLVASSSDAWRSLAQLHFTAPLYAAIGYSLGTLLALRVPMPRAAICAVRRLDEESTRRCSRTRISMVLVLCRGVEIDR